MPQAARHLLRTLERKHRIAEIMLTNSDLIEIEAKCNAARPGPWKSYVEGRDHEAGSNFIMVGKASARGADIELTGATVADQDFIAAARQAIPDLISEIKRLKHLLGENAL